MARTSTLLLTDDAVAAQAERLRAAAEKRYARGRRFVLGIAGIPGSGKSTLGQRLVEILNGRGPRSGLAGEGAIRPFVAPRKSLRRARLEGGSGAGGAGGTAVLISMDGFHLRNAVLEAQGTRGRKGAWFTYDAVGYVARLERYADAANVGGFPEYCRVVHEPVPSQQRVTDATRIIVTEGQYLLAGAPPWSAVRSVLDESWWIDLPAGRARAWLKRRDLGVGRSAAQAEAKYQDNDRLNTQWVLAHRAAADVQVRWPEGVAG